MKCPKCGSEHVQFSTSTSGGGYDVLGGCCCYTILGPLGLLCGLCDSGVTTEEFWICHDCGNKFSAGKARRTIERENELANKEAEKYLEAKKQLDGVQPSKIIPNLYAAKHKYSQLKSEMDTLYAELVASSNRKLRKSVKIARTGSPTAICEVIAWVVFAFSALFAILGAVPAIILAIFSGIVILVARHRFKKAKEYILSTRPDFWELREKLYAASSEKESWETKKHAQATVKEYEERYQE